MHRSVVSMLGNILHTAVLAATDDSEGGLALGNKIYHIDIFLRNQIATFFELHLSTIFNGSSNTSQEKMSRLGFLIYIWLTKGVVIFCFGVCKYTLCMYACELECKYSPGSVREID